MTWGEAVRLTIALAADPSSHVGAAVNGMQFPASREYLAVQRMNANLVAQRTEKRPRFGLLPDPFDKPPQRYGGRAMSRAELDAVLSTHRALPAVPQEATVI